MPETYRVVCERCSKSITTTSLALNCSRCGLVIGLEKPEPTEQAQQVMAAAREMASLIEANRRKAAMA